jgi:uncharacterized protein YajQ (UPF0234 family)
MKVEKQHQALIEFSLWSESSMMTAINNVLELKKANPQGITNPVLIFVVPRAMNYVVERFVLEVFQAWGLLNAELKRQKLRTLGSTNKDFQHLKRIRNKLVAHKIENSILSDRHEIWYKKTYGNYETVLALIVRIAEKLGHKIRKLELDGKLSVKSTIVNVVTPFSTDDINKLLEAIQKQGIY